MSITRAKLSCETLQIYQVDILVQLIDTRAYRKQKSLFGKAHKWFLCVLRMSQVLQFNKWIKEAGAFQKPT